MLMLCLYTVYRGGERCQCCVSTLCTVEGRGVDVVSTLSTEMGRSYARSLPDLADAFLCHRVHLQLCQRLSLCQWQVRFTVSSFRSRMVNETINNFTLYLFYVHGSKKQ